MSKAPDQLKCLDIMWEGHADCQHCAIRKYDILANVDVKKYQHLLNRIIQLSYAEKTMLFVESTPAKDLFVIRNGLIKLEDSLSDGSARIVRLLSKASIVGLEAFLNNHQRYDQTAIALQKTSVCRIPQQVFKDLLKLDPDFHQAVLTEWHSQLVASNNVVVDFSTGTLKQRIARVLLFLIDEAKHNNKIEITMLHLDDFAALTGVTKESVSRKIAAFKRHKLISKSGPNKVRFDEVALRKLLE